MLREAIGKGATVDEAAKKAKAQLAAPEEADIKIEILKQPQKKTFGIFGGSDAEVKVSYDDGKAEPKPVVTEKKAEEPKKEAPAVKKEEKKPEPKKEVVVEITKPFVRTDLEPTDEYKAAEEYLKAMILGIGMESCEVKTSANDEEIVFELDCGDDYGLVIGRRGETLDAVQYLTRMVANHGKGTYKRVSVNVGNYREKREAALRSLARRDAIRAVKTGRNVTLEPMNPYERRIIHTAVQEINGATSYSTGADLDRRVTIAPDGTVKATPRDESFHKDNFRRNDRNDRHDSFRGSDKSEQEPSAPARAPKSDFEGTSLYGKIEVKKDETEE